MNDPFIPTLEEFLAFTRTTALARVNRFAVNFSYPLGLVTSGDAYNVSMLCEEASLPGKQIMPRSLRINALSEPRAHTVDFWNDTASFQFLIDNDFAPRRFFEDWMTLCVGTGVTREIGDYDQYVAPVLVHALAPTSLSNIDAQGNPEFVLWSMKLVDAWPRSIVIAPVGSSNTTIHRMVVTFMYKRWESLDQDGNNREFNSGATPIPATLTDAGQPGEPSLLDSISAARQSINKTINSGKKQLDVGLTATNRIAQGLRAAQKLNPFLGI